MTEAEKIEYAMLLAKEDIRHIRARGVEQLGLYIARMLYHLRHINERGLGDPRHLQALRERFDAQE